jgi:hypothetical protein
MDEKWSQPLTVGKTSPCLSSQVHTSLLTTILPNVVGRMTAKRKVASSNLITDDFLDCNPTSKACSCGLCGYLGMNSGEGVKLVSNPRKADKNHSPSHRIKSNQSTLAAKRTGKSPFFYYYSLQIRSSQVDTSLLLTSLTPASSSSSTMLPPHDKEPQLNAKRRRNRVFFPAKYITSPLLLNCPFNE